MDNKRFYQDDLEGVKGMPLNPKDLPFIVPNDYFSTLETKIRHRIRVISATEKCFKVPKHYFETLPSRIQERIAFEEQADTNQEPSFIEQLKVTAPTSGFSIPNGYFDDLNTAIVQAVDDQPEQKNKQANVIPLQKRRARPATWIGYVAAACIAISIGTYTFFQLHHTTDTFENRLKNIPDNDIVSYLEYYSESGDGAAFETQFEGVLQLDEKHFSDEEIEAYLANSI
ncbi:hypothetical protein GCM10023231_26310 [Olivibacter ginsenosidimutans]|uniref:Uncharacterized protein n=1 Tax=Olivibacter ginsenosidimutans TaxID=1176537 RepID=A0ABP9BMB1_9SPHI